MEQHQRYAIIDGASETDFQLMLERYNPPHCCLYAEPVQPELLELAPWLVLVDDPVEAWLESRDTPWGIYLYSQANIKLLRQHLRKYLHVQIPEQEKPVYFRFYDPRTIWDFLQVMSDWDIHTFLGPVTKIRTSYNAVEREDDFAARREPFPDEAKAGRKMLKISEVQYERINALAEERYIGVLALEVERYWLSDHQVIDEDSGVFERIYNGSDFTVEEAAPGEMVSKEAGGQGRNDARTLVYGCFSFCKENAITDDQSIRLMVYLLLKKDIAAIDTLPDEWKKPLTQKAIPGYYRVESLMLTVFGELPDVSQLIKGR